MAKPRKMLSDIDIPAVDGLFRLIPSQSKETVAKWAVDYAGRILLPLWVKYCPDDVRPQDALDAARDMIAKKIKWSELNPKVADCISAAKDMENELVPRGAARAIAQCSSAIHSASHAIGLALYGALAVAYDKVGVNAPRDEQDRVASEECERMLAALQSVAVTNEPNPCKVSWKC
jgi:hypothetical protein